jgi:hypothetical protein
MALDIHDIPRERLETALRRGRLLKCDSCKRELPAAVLDSRPAAVQWDDIRIRTCPACKHGFPPEGSSNGKASSSRQQPAP